MLRTNINLKEYKPPVYETCGYKFEKLAEMDFYLEKLIYDNKIR
jgi:hypothetical protein